MNFFKKKTKRIQGRDNTYLKDGSKETCTTSIIKPMVTHHAPIMKHKVLNRWWQWVGIGRGISGRSPSREKLMSTVCNNLKHSPISKTRYLLLHLLQCGLELLHLGHAHPFDGPGPPQVGLGFLLLEIQLVDRRPSSRRRGGC